MKIKNIVYVGLYTAILCVLSPISVPIGLLPVTLSNMIVILISLLAGFKGSVAVFLYVLLGAFGLPVFSNFAGGFQKLLGITGGYIMGYIPASLIVSLIINKYKHKCSYYISSYIGNVIIWIFGTMWYMFYAKVSFLNAVAICVLPFIILDIIKATFSAYISLKVKKRLEKNINF